VNDAVDKPHEQPDPEKWGSDPVWESAMLKDVARAANYWQAKYQALWADVLRTQKDVKGGMKVGPLPYYCPFCPWDEKSQVALVKHMAEKHQQVCRGLKGTT
jgi:hypothetical protein